ncbi:hypothetical protein IPJ70_00005 [Candidatus Campbellbacteria bacterium]|nr:MAG: hypothetical protein IPJ70_00005 [Candidatus Campbellbacteria bacterium]
MELTIEKAKMTPKDFFMYFGTAVSLYVSAGALLALLFSIINTLLPDVLNPQYTSSWSMDGMRFSISTLIVAFPLYIVLSWLIRKDIAKDIQKYQLSIRKWFVYLTLFIAGATVAGDVIALVNTYLGGEIPARFIWKVLSVFVVATVVFVYYFYDLRRAESKDTKVNKTLIIIASIGVVAAIVSGIVVAGSPSQARAIRFDEQRVNDLSNIQSQVIQYYQYHAVLPGQLSVLTDTISGYTAPLDPETKNAYEYKMLAPLSFELCATFTQENLDTTKTAPMYYDMGGMSGNFTHAAGRVCFERVVDPKAYPVFKQ